MVSLKSWPNKVVDLCWKYIQSMNYIISRFKFIINWKFCKNTRELAKLVNTSWIMIVIFILQILVNVLQWLLPEMLVTNFKVWSILIYSNHFSQLFDNSKICICYSSYCWILKFFDYRLEYYHISFWIPKPIILLWNIAIVMIN